MLDKISALKERWIELYDSFSDFRETWLASVVRWEWANGPRYDPRPFYFQRETAKGRLLRRELPHGEKHDGVWKHGYDDQGRIVLSRSDNGEWETLFSFESEFVEMTRYQTRYKLLRGISRVYFKDRQPSYFISVMLRGDQYSFQGSPQEIWREAFDKQLEFGVDREDYHYTNRRLTEITRIHWNQGWLHDRREFKYESIYLLSYDENGVLDRIEHTNLSRTAAGFGLIYQKRQRRETLASLIEHTKMKLIEAIPQVISKANFSEPLYCVQLVYRYQDLFPPSIWPGLEARRKQVLETVEPRFVSSEVWASVWDFEEKGDEDFAIEDEETLIACRRVQLEIIRGTHTRHQQALRALYQVAKALNQLDWSAYAPVTSDFIVFAYDQEPLWRALRSSGATSDQISNWRKQGLL